MNIEYSSKKARNIRENPRVSFVVDDVLWEEILGVIVSGKAELISKGKLHQIGLDLIYKKYPKLPLSTWSKYTLVITPTKVTSWGL